jgi:hypothetical protein
MPDGVDAGQGAPNPNDKEDSRQQLARNRRRSAMAR